VKRNEYCIGVCWQRLPWVVVLAILFKLVFGASVAWAQTGALGTIHGTVSDASGAALPGVTVTITSTALQVGRATLVTEPDGTYRFGDLPVGTYKLSFELSGFKTLIRDEVRVPVGFVARIDVTLAVGGIEETVTVSGQSPVVDQTTTTTSVNLTQETLESVPVGRGFQFLFAMTPGVTTAGAPDVGDSALASRSNVQSYGGSGTSTMNVEGINITSGESSAVYFTNFSFEEVQIKTSGNDAEVSTPGISMVSVLKSGSNQFHGTYAAAYEGSGFESSNLTPQLMSQGITASAPLRYYYEGGADLGGRIVKDKLWFYVSTNRQQRVSNLLGFASGPGPDGKYLTGDEPLADYQNNLSDHAVKLSYQASQKNRLIGVWHPMLKYQPQRNGGRFRPLESTLDYRNPGGVYKGELQSTLSTRMVANLVAGWGGNHEDYSVARSKYGRAVPGNPSKTDIRTSLSTGAGTGSQLNLKDRWQLDGSVSFFPEDLLGGKHELKAGTTMYWHRIASGTQNNPAGNYILSYDNGAPNQIQILNAPNLAKNSQDIYGFYLKDTWRVTNNLTANLGVRYEYQHAFIPAQSKEASAAFPGLFPAAQFSNTDIMTWNSVVPRAGIAWSLDRKTVVKASYGRFNGGMLALGIGESGFSAPYNPIGSITDTFRWRDQNTNGDYDPGEVNLDVNGPDFVSVSGSSNNLLNPDLRQPMTNEATAGFERELVANLGFRALYVYKDYHDSVVTVNVLRPRSAYNIPITRRDPGPDGVLNTGDDAGKVTIYDYDAAYRGAAFVANQRQNSPLTSRYQSVEMTVTKRSSGRFFGMASFWATKNHRWISSFPAGDPRGVPNDDSFPLDSSWTWASNVSGSYRLPWDINIGAYLQSKIGAQGQRTYIFAATDPDGGTPLRQLNNVTMRLEPYGTQLGPAVRILNLRATKAFSIRGGTKLELNVEAFNVLNSSAPLQIVYASGPTFGWFGTANSGSAGDTGIVIARVARLGLRYRF
jgi:Carboxypeptidase regulatory-like domain/TonB dependent receptor-like, beta-barrel